jgi:hypothetical protein
MVYCLARLDAFVVSLTILILLKSTGMGEFAERQR